MPHERMPHDAAYKAFFSDKVMVTGLFQDFVPMDFVRDMDFTTLELVPASHVSKEFRQRHNDIIWRVRWKAIWCYLYLLMEFQSVIDPFMAVRVLVYTGLFWENLIARGEIKAGDTLPPVFPLVLYNGKTAWNAPQDVDGLLAKMPEGLKVYQPSQKFFLIDELSLPENLVREGQSPAADLVRLERVTKDGIFATLREVRGHMETFPGPVKEKFYSWFWYIFKNRFESDISLQTLRELLEDRTMFEETCAELVDSLIQKGKDLGREEGWRDGQKSGWKGGKAEVALNLRRLGMPLEQIAVATGFSVDEIHQLCPEQ